MARLSIWKSAEVRECYNEDRQSIVQDTLWKSTDLLWRIILPVEGEGGSLWRVCALIATDARLKTTSGGYLLDTERCNAIGGVRRAEASTAGRPK